MPFPFSESSWESLTVKTLCTNKLGLNNTKLPPLCFGVSWHAAQIKTIMWINSATGKRNAGGQNVNFHIQVYQPFWWHGYRQLLSFCWPACSLPAEGWGSLCCLLDCSLVMWRSPSCCWRKLQSAKTQATWCVTAIAQRDFAASLAIGTLTNTYISSCKNFEGVKIHFTNVFEQ